MTVEVSSPSFQSRVGEEILRRETEDQVFSRFAAEELGIPRKYTEQEIQWMANDMLQDFGRLYTRAFGDGQGRQVMRGNFTPLGTIGLELPEVFILHPFTITRQIAVGNEIVVKVKEQNTEIMEEIIDLYSSVAERIPSIDVDFSERIHFDSWSHENWKRTEEFLEQTDASYTFTSDAAAERKEEIHTQRGFPEHQTIFAEGYSGIIVLDGYDASKSAEKIVSSFTWANGRYCENAGWMAYPIGSGDLLDEIIRETKSLKSGAPMDPETDIGQFDTETQTNFEEYVDWLKDELGYDVLVGGEVVGDYIQPTIVNIPRDEGDSYHRIADEYVFPDFLYPVLITVPYDEKEHGVQIAKSGTKESYRGRPLSLSVIGNSKNAESVFEAVQPVDRHYNAPTTRIDVAGPHEGKWLMDVERIQSPGLTQRLLSNLQKFQ